MQGIKTIKYGPHAIMARCDARTIVLTKDDKVGHGEHHRRAALKLATLMNWYGIWVGGTVPGVEGMVWLSTQETNRDEECFVVTKPQPPPTDPANDDIITHDNVYWYCDNETYFKGSEEDLLKKMDQDKFWPYVWRFDGKKYNIIHAEKNGRMVP